MEQYITSEDDSISHRKTGGVENEGIQCTICIYQSMYLLHTFSDNHREKFVLYVPIYDTFKSCYSGTIVENGYRNLSQVICHQMKQNFTQFMKVYNSHFPLLFRSSYFR